ncbi:MAG TPA: beta-N-acetylhexosaminidase [Polyangiales bacterium]|nr:beta-N-acetylhexosaminidase [Polyangiales bacterium]
MRDDVGQLLWIGFEGTTAPAALRAKLASGAVGATVIFKRNLVLDNEVCDLDALVALNASLHVATADGTPALIAVDQEGGTVQRVRAPATIWPPMLAHDGITDDEATAQQVGLAMGQELRAFGFDIDFAPVLDIHTNAANPVIGERAFGTTPDTVARRALAYARGLDEAGILSCGKHFPGHGDTATDSHLELPRVDHAWDRLEAIELAPFARAAEAKLPMLMTAHVVFAVLDEARPATLSDTVITGLLRKRLHYDGVIVSDDLDMHAITANVGAADAAVAAIRAGCDVLLLCRDEANQAAAEESLLRAAETDSDLRARIGESAARVRAMKRAHLENQSRRPSPGRDIIATAAHRALSDRLRAGLRR